LQAGYVRTLVLLQAAEQLASGKAGLGLYLRGSLGMQLHAVGSNVKCIEKLKRQAANFEVALNLELGELGPCRSRVAFLQFGNGWEGCGLQSWQVIFNMRFAFPPQVRNGNLTRRGTRLHCVKSPWQRAPRQREISETVFKRMLVRRAKAQESGQEATKLAKELARLRE
jgi:hypothetical protein